jgi:hypothetical protein
MGTGVPSWPARAAGGGPGEVGRPPRHVGPAALGQEGMVLQGRRSRHTGRPPPAALPGVFIIVVCGCGWIASREGSGLINKS